MKTSLKTVPKGPINNIPALVQIMAWCRPGDKPLSEPMLVSFRTSICVTWPQWFKAWRGSNDTDQLPLENAGFSIRRVKACHLKPLLHIGVFCQKTVVTPPTWEPQTNAIKFSASAFTFSSAIETDQVVVHLQHWYGSHTLCRGCTMLSRTLLGSLAMYAGSLVLVGTSTPSLTLTGGIPTFLGAHIR